MILGLSTSAVWQQVRALEVKLDESLIRRRGRTVETTAAGRMLLELAQPHVAGLHDHEGTTIYVSRGTGYWGPPMRVAAAPEITRIELVNT